MPVGRARGGESIRLGSRALGELKGPLGGFTTPAAFEESGDFPPPWEHLVWAGGPKKRKEFLERSRKPPKVWGITWGSGFEKTLLEFPQGPQGLSPGGFPPTGGGGGTLFVLGPPPGKNGCVSPPGGGHTPEGILCRGPFKHCPTGGKRKAHTHWVLSGRQ